MASLIAGNSDTDTTTNDYAVTQKVVHWLMALAIMLDLFIAQKFGNPMELADRLESRLDHASLGTIVTVFFMLRIRLRIE
jgi:cytochrome b561